MDNSNRRPTQADPNMVGTPDWRITQLPADARQRIVNKIMGTLKEFLPYSEPEGLMEIEKIAVRFEEKIYTSANSQIDYLRKISFKMLTGGNPKPGNQNPNLLRSKMTTVPGSLIWEIVKKNNSFLVKEFGNGSQMIQFSKESNNLYNLNSFKHSGLANKKTVSVQPAGKDLGVVLSTTKSKKQNKPAKLLHKSVMNKEFTKMAKAVSNQVGDNHYRPDLKNAALARLSAVYRSLKVSKSGVKKRNRQNVRISGRK